MSNLKDYIDGLLDSGAETFPREVLEKIKAMAGELQIVEKVVYPFVQLYPYWWQPVTIPPPPSPTWITTGGTLDCRSGSVGSNGIKDVSATVGGHAGRGAECVSSGSFTLPGNSTGGVYTHD